MSNANTRAISDLNTREKLWLGWLWVIALAGLAVTASALFSGALELFAGNPKVPDVWAALFILVLLGGGFVTISLRFAEAVSARPRKLGPVVWRAIVMLLALLVVAFFSFRFWYEMLEEPFGLAVAEASGNLGDLRVITESVETEAGNALSSEESQIKSQAAVITYANSLDSFQTALVSPAVLSQISASLRSSQDERRAIAQAEVDRLDDELTAANAARLDANSRLGLIDSRIETARGRLSAFGENEEAWDQLLSNLRVAFELECPTPRVSPFEPQLFSGNSFRTNCGPSVDVEDQAFAANLETEISGAASPQFCLIRANVRNTGTGPCTDFMLRNYRDIFQARQALAAVVAEKEALSTTAGGSSNTIQTLQNDLDAAKAVLANIGSGQEINSATDQLETLIGAFRDAPTQANFEPLVRECIRLGDIVTNAGADPTGTVVPECAGQEAAALVTAFQSQKNRLDAALLACTGADTAVADARAKVQASDDAEAALPAVFAELTETKVKPCIAAGRAAGVNVTAVADDLDALESGLSQDTPEIGQAFDRYSEILTGDSNLRTYGVLAFTLIVELWFFGMKVAINDFQRRSGEGQGLKARDEQDVKAAANLVELIDEYDADGRGRLNEGYEDNVNDATAGRMRRLLGQLMVSGQARKRGGGYVLDRAGLDQLEALSGSVPDNVVDVQPVTTPVEEEVVAPPPPPPEDRREEKRSSLLPRAKLTAETFFPNQSQQTARRATPTDTVRPGLTPARPVQTAQDAAEDDDDFEVFSDRVISSQFRKWRRSN